MTLTDKIVKRLQVSSQPLTAREVADAVKLGSPPYAALAQLVDDGIVVESAERPKRYSVAEPKLSDVIDDERTRPVLPALGELYEVVGLNKRNGHVEIDFASTTSDERRTLIAS